MARPPASNRPGLVVLAAAAAWAAAAGVLLALPVAPIPPRPAPLRTVPSHHPGAGAAWNGAGRVYDELDRHARGLPRDERVRLARVILEEAARAELPPLLVLAVIRVESRFDPRAISPVGAVGLMQLMLPTLREELGRARLGDADPFDPVVNVRAGVRYLSRLVQDFEDVELALMAYNAGPNRIRRYLEAGGVPARFLGYPRDVLHHLERNAPGSRPSLPGVARTALAAAHPVRHALDGAAATAVHHRPSRAAELASAPVLAALQAGARDLPALAAAERDPAELAAPPASRPSRDACVRLEPALPMVRGPVRTRAEELATAT